MKNRDILKALTLFTQFGISMVTPIIISIVFFKFIADKLFSGNNMVVVFGVILGALTSFWTMYKMIKEKSDKNE